MNKNHKHKQRHGKPKVLMLGWEFPPHNSGGLGTACEGLVKGLSKKGVKVTFVLPKTPGIGINCDFADIISASKSAADSNIKLKIINANLSPYMTAESYRTSNKAFDEQNIYGKNLFEEVARYSELVKEICSKYDFDVIHAHDWMTYKAGINVKKKTGKPLVVHMHATELDRTGGNNVNQFVYDTEREGMHFADAVCPVSNYTKSKIMHHYGVPEHKIHVVHNAVDFKSFNDTDKTGSAFGQCNNPRNNRHNNPRDNPRSKLVLFLGRITLQKGPDYFVHAAKKVLEKDPDARFIVAGSGDMEPKIIEKAAELGIADRVLFSGFLRGSDIDRAYRMADVYVMPSVSEPFGITPLEAMKNGTPCIISKQSGVSEVIKHCLKVDFWDIDEMANKILGVLQYKALKESLSENGNNEVKKFSWNVPAQKCLDVYEKVLK